jgi:ribose transport system substrate-binding protein
MSLRRLQVVAAMSGCVVLAAACGSSSSGGAAKSATSSGLVSQAAAATVRAKVKALEVRPTTLGITARVNGVPKNKTVAILYSPDPSAVQTKDYFQAALAAVGWKLAPIQIGLTPQALQAGFNLALRDNVAAIVSTGTDPSEFASQLATARARHIPVVLESSPVPSGGGIISISGPGQARASGIAEADFLLNKTGGKLGGKTLTPLLLPLAAFPYLTDVDNGFMAEWTKECPACAKPETDSLPASSLGTNLPSLVTAYLERHREVNYLVIGYSDMALGLAPALDSAGFGSIRAIVINTTPQIDALINSGTLVDAAIDFPEAESMWAAADALIRYYDGQPTAADVSMAGVGSPLQWIVTKAGIAAAGLTQDTSSFPMDPDYESQFKDLWGMGSSS